jgi:nitrate/nitrite-specific signal transduction histidine kinase
VARPEPSASPLSDSVEALDVFVALLSEVEAAEPTDAFYSRLCEATCRLTAMRRALILLYDDDRREVRAVGSHGVPLDLLEHANLTPATAESVRQSLEEDRVLDVSEQFARELPERFLPLLQDGLLTCTPMSAGGRWYGVILADRAPDGGPLTDPQRHTLWTLGKVCALAASARIATHQRERAQQLSERLHLARDVHDRVIQRLFGVSLALSAETLDPDARERCVAELQGALGDLRAVMQRPPEAPPTGRGLPLRDALHRLRERHSDVAVELVEGEAVEVPPELERLAVSVLVEAVRNAVKHSSPSRIDVRLAEPDGAFVLEVINDGASVGRPRGRTGMGLRLTAFQALEQGGIVEFGATGEGQWRVRLAVPRGDR